jgi:xylulokinase
MPSPSSTSAAAHTAHATNAHFLGIDIAQSGLNLVLLAGAGETVATLQRAYGSNDTVIGDPQDWWRAVRTGIKEILRRAHVKPEHIRAIGVTGESDSLIAIAKDGKVLCPSVLGPDPRAESQVEAVKKSIGMRTLLNLSSGNITSGSMLAKLFWLREHEKRVWHDLGAALTAKDFLRFRLCETLVTDASDASLTSLFNPKTRAWSKQLLTTCAINPEWLPTVNGGQVISGRVTSTAARETGLISGTPVITGAGHAAASAIGAGILGAGTAMVELGDVGGILLPTDEAVRDNSGLFLTTCHTIAGTWTLAYPHAAHGISLAWLQNHLFSSEVMQAKRAGRDPLEPLAELAAEIAPGADGLLHISTQQHSTLSGFFGLKPQHGRGHLVRAVLESGALSVKAGLNALTAMKRQPNDIVVVGPGAANHLWCQIVADAANHTIHAIPTVQIAATGAAILASSAVGLHKSIDEACAALVGQRIAYEPRKAAADIYNQLLPAIGSLSQISLPNSTPPDQLVNEVHA